MVLVDGPSGSRTAVSGGSGQAASGVPGWVDATGTVRARLDTWVGTAVVRIVAELDRHALGPCREALDHALGSSPVGVVVDLGEMREVTSTSIAFLGCMRRYLQARHRELVLANTPTGLQEAMDRVHVLPLYVFAATTSEAVALLGTRAARRPAVVVDASAGADDGVRPGRDRSTTPACCVGCLDCS